MRRGALAAGKCTCVAGKGRNAAENKWTGGDCCRLSGQKAAGRATTCKVHATRRQSRLIKPSIQQASRVVNAAKLLLRLLLVARREEGEGEEVEEEASSFAINMRHSAKVDSFGERSASSERGKSLDASRFARSLEAPRRVWRRERNISRQLKKPPPLWSRFACGELPHRIRRNPPVARPTWQMRRQQAKSQLSCKP